MMSVHTIWHAPTCSDGPRRRRGSCKLEWLCWTERWAQSLISFQASEEEVPESEDMLERKHLMMTAVCYWKNTSSAVHSFLCKASVIAGGMKKHLEWRAGWARKYNYVDSIWNLGVILPRCGWGVPPNSNPASGPIKVGCQKGSVFCLSLSLQ